MANDDDKKTSDAPEASEEASAKTSEPPKMAESESPEAVEAEETAAVAKAGEAAREEEAAGEKLAEARGEADPKAREAKAEAAAEKAAEAKADAEDAAEMAADEGETAAETSAEITKDAARETQEEALEEAAAARAAHSDHPPAAATEDDEPGTRPALFLAEYDTADDLVHAAENMRDAGYEHWDCHTPYPVHGLDQAMGLPETKIGYISFVCGMVGLVSAVLMIQFMNNWDYPIIIGGKPPGAFPSMVPIMFELTVLLTGFGTLFGLFHLCRLPRHHHPIFESDRFESSTDDKFFISVEVEDPKFDLAKTRALLEGTHPSHLELVEEEIA